MPKQPIPVYIDTPDSIKPDTTPTYQQRNQLPRFRTKYPRQLDDYQGSNNSGVSLTIPNETYTIRELLNKHTSGIMPEVANQPIWQEEASHDSPDLQKLDRLDIVEKQIERERQTNIIDQLDEIVQEQRKLREQKQRLINESDSNDKTSESEAKAQNNVEDNE